MKRVFLVALFLCSGFIVASQIELFNNTGKSVLLSFKFFHKKAKQKMVISGFQLGSQKKTCFPQAGDLHIADPIKLKVQLTNDPSSSVSKKFNRGDVQLHSFAVVKNKNKLELHKRVKSQKR